MDRKNTIKTGDFPIVDEWTNNTWPRKAKEVITFNIADYREEVLFRSSETVITINAPIKKSYQIIIDYCHSKNCFLVYNAAIQKHIRHGKKIRINIGKNVKERLSQPIDSDSIISIFPRIRWNGHSCVEHVLIIGENAIERFCKSYKEMIVPDKELIPRGKNCLYAESGKELQQIHSAHT